MCDCSWLVHVHLVKACNSGGKLLKVSCCLPIRARHRGSYAPSRRTCQIGSVGLEANNGMCLLELLRPCVLFGMVESLLALQRNLVTSSCCLISSFGCTGGSRFGLIKGQRYLKTAAGNSVWCCLRVTSAVKPHPHERQQRCRARRSSVLFRFRRCLN